MPGATPDSAVATKCRVAVEQTGLGEASATFQIGLRSVPFLADHAVQDLVVLPGAFYLELARCVERELSRGTPGLVRNMTFHRPITLAADDTVVRVRVRDLGDGRAAYAFHEAGDGQGDGAGTPAATLVVDRIPTPAGGEVRAPSFDAFQQSGAALDAGQFYGRMRANGNQYGPGFQRVRSVWRTGDQALGQLAVSPPAEGGGRAGLPPSVVDSLTQLLATFMMDQGKTFLLQSIAKVEVRDPNIPDTLWGHAVLHRQGGPDGDGFTGSVWAFDDAGRQYLELSGVTFTYLDPVAHDPEAAPATRFVLTANFTAEPIEDSLRFWGTQFGVPIQATFAPYNQIFQQLLDPGSALRNNRDGVNVILLALEEWIARERATGTTLHPERAAECFGGRKRYTLPNGLEIVHLNSYETDYLYQEIFEDRVYLRHGIQLPDGATVLDIGANIGLFSLFVMSRCQHPTIYAFEPARAAHDLLKANCDAYGPNVTALNLGVGNEAKTATFTFYEQSSVFSGFHPDPAEDRAAVQTVVRNTLSRSTEADGEAVERHVAALTAHRLRGTTHECRITTVSDVIREHRIERIDLLKIDAEKSEWEVLEGIAERDWPRIAQIVMEIHDRTRTTVARIEALLAGKGFHCVVEGERLLADSGLYTLFATRNEAAVPPEPRPPRPVHDALQRNVRDLCAALHEVVRQSPAPIVLCVCPRTPAAERDPDLAEALDDAERWLLSQVHPMTSVSAIGSASLRERYPCDDSYDPHGHHLGHMPYTPKGYAAIGTALFRAVAQLRSRRFKVIVVDCDNTLWRGVCGEDGPGGLDVSEPYRRLQEFLVGQVHAGLLLCLSSKNNEGDVLEVFAQRPDMVLGREHLVSWRINWHSKSDNLHSLAHELDVGLDSFIFIDDNPVDCADVRYNCPGVLTLQLPRDAGSWPRFLSHVWAFDHAGTTAEDRDRTKMYQENAKRRALREQVPSLKAFVRGLDLRVELTDLAAHQLDRVSQLTLRTNQFTLTAVRRSQREIEDFLRQPRAAGLVVHVADRFGDYGLVGVVLHESLADRYRVDTLLLSCRVLGRGVEHAVVSQLGRRAVHEGKRFVELSYRPTGRNAPAGEFLARLDPESTGSRTSWAFPADRLASLEYDPDESGAERAAAPAARGSASLPRRPGSGFGDRDLSEVLPRIAERLYDADRIAEAIEEDRLRDDAAHRPGVVAPRGTLEASLLGIWRRVLGRPGIGMRDGFFESGGTSLKAVQVVAMIKRELQREVSLVGLFECPTVTLLAARLRSATDEPDAVGADQAARRGRRRKALRRGAA